MSEILREPHPWIERHLTFLHNWAEVDFFIWNLMEEAKKTFGDRDESAEPVDV